MGTGLGLSLVKAMAHLHGGGMSLSSRLGEGTTVRVTLPLGRTEATDASDDTAPIEGGISLEAAARAAINPLEDYTYTPDTMSGFGDFVIRPPCRCAMALTNDRPRPVPMAFCSAVPDCS